MDAYVVHQWDYGLMAGQTVKTSEIINMTAVLHVVHCPVHLWHLVQRSVNGRWILKSILQTVNDLLAKCNKHFLP